MAGPARAPSDESDDLERKLNMFKTNLATVLETIALKPDKGKGCIMLKGINGCVEIHVDKEIALSLAEGGVRRFNVTVEEYKGV